MRITRQTGDLFSPRAWQPPGDRREWFRQTVPEDTILATIPRVPPSRKGDLTASMAILGLVVREPDTLAGIRRRLTERFPHSAWSSSVAYADLESLAKQGLVRLTEAGEKRGEDGYEATPEGATRFREWLREASEAAPALHDPTRARLRVL